MAREPQFVFNGNSFAASLVKLERNKVYGYTGTKYTDNDGNPCHFITMMDDGRTMLGNGAVSLKSIDSSFDEIDKTTVKAQYLDGTDAPLIPSIFDTETVLDDTKTIYDYLDMDVKSVYQLKIENSKDEILAALIKSKVLYFKFNYRSSYDADDAFLISQGDQIFAVVGNITDFNYSTLDLPTVLEDEAEENSEELDFNMF